jgi:hypothetical protein
MEKRKDGGKGGLFWSIELRYQARYQESNRVGLVLLSRFRLWLGMTRLIVASFIEMTILLSEGGQTGSLSPFDKIWSDCLTIMNVSEVHEV